MLMLIFSYCSFFLLNKYNSTFSFYKIICVTISLHCKVYVYLVLRVRRGVLPLVYRVSRLLKTQSIGLLDYYFVYSTQSIDLVDYSFPLHRANSGTETITRRDSASLSQQTKGNSVTLRAIARLHPISPIAKS